MKNSCRTFVPSSIPTELLSEVSLIEAAPAQLMVCNQRNGSHMKALRGSRIGYVLAVIVIISLPVFAAKKRSAKAAPAQGNDVSPSFSLVLRPAKQPFCEISETVKSSERALERDHIHALLKPGICKLPATHDQTTKTPNWELDQDPFIGKPFLDSGTWDQAPVDWAGVDGDDPNTCLAGSADIVMERAFRYGFCDSDQYNVGNTLEMTDKTFGLQKADYYIVNIVVWKSDPVKTVQVSKVSGLKLTDKVSNSGKITITTNDTCEYQLRAGSIGDLIKAINADSKACGKAGLVNGQLAIFAADGKSDVTIEGDTDQIGKWVNPQTYSVQSSSWYAFNHGDHGKLIRQRLSSFSNEYPFRIYGTQKPIGLVAIHVKPSNDTWELFQQLKVKYTISVSKKTSTPVSDFQGLLGIIFNASAFGAVPKQDPDGFYGSTFFNAASPSDLTIAAEVDFPKWQQPGTGSKTAGPNNTTASQTPRMNGVKHATVTYPAGGAVLSTVALRVELDRSNNIETQTLPHDSGNSLLESTENSWRPAASEQTAQPTSNSAPDAAKPSQQGGTPKPSGSDTSGASTKSGGKSTTNSKSSTQPVPTAPTVDCQPTIDSSGQQAPCKFSSTFNDEDLTHWDVSFGVPFKTLTDLQYNQSSGSDSSVIPKKVTRLNAYGFFDIFPVATDIVTPPIIAWPHIKLGLPISGKVFNKPFFGMGDGIRIKKLLNIIPIQFSFFGGVVYNKEFRQIPGTVGSSNVQGHRVWSGSYGIEIPVKQFKSALSSKNKSNSSSGKTTGGNNSTGNNTTQGNNSSSSQ